MVLDESDSGEVDGKAERQRLRTCQLTHHDPQLKIDHKESWAF